MRTEEIRQLVDETADLTGERRPELMGDNSPVLTPQTLAESGFYLIGIIGGKDVGKSSLVNALVGREITAETSSGPGTEDAIAYAHRSCVEQLEPMLANETGGRFRIVSHDVAELSRQVLLDLPDIDSIHESHIELTRRMLRHMLFPIWVQSVEKYADWQPQQLLARVAAGNDPANFIFCLNKIDQLVAREGWDAAEQLRDDYAGRIARVLQMDAPPRVHLISAIQPKTLDLPQLRARLSRQKEEPAVAQSRSLAGRRQDRSLLSWLDDQHLPRRLERLDRLLDTAQELTAERVGVPIFDRALPAMIADSAYRSAVTEPAVTARLARWPIVGALNSVLSPVLSLAQRGASKTGIATPAIDPWLSEAGADLPTLISTTFAQLHQTNPAIGELYAQQRLWEHAPSQYAAAKLRTRLSETIARQRDAAIAPPRLNWLGAPIRWLLTIGAVLWFPLVQPILEALLQPGVTARTLNVALLAVKLLSVAHLLMSLAFLALYFLTLWMLLRYGVVQSLSRLTQRWARDDAAQRDLSCAGAAMDWIDDLFDPIRDAHRQVESLVERIDRARNASSVTAA
jgi:50S ribosome-binding GTPase